MAPPASSDSTVEPLVLRYNSRNIGSPGWRRISVEIRGAAGVTRSYSVLNLWKKSGDRCATLFYLEDSTHLTGTRYLQLEDPAASPELAVYLYLPAGRRDVMRIAPSLHGEGLLGSDFSYSDVSMLLPLRDCLYTPLGEAFLDGVPVWKVEAVRDSGAASGIPWERAVYYFCKDKIFLLGADYFALSDSKTSPPLLKSMRVESYDDIEGVRTAKRMVMRRPSGESTTLTLRGAGFGRSGIADDLFRPENLGSMDSRSVRSATEH